MGALVGMSGGSVIEDLNCLACYSPSGTADLKIYPISIQFLSAEGREHFSWEATLLLVFSWASWIRGTELRPDSSRIR